MEGMRYTYGFSGFTPCMAVIDVRPALIRGAIDEHEQMRLSELREEVGFDNVAEPLLQLVEDGDVALLPIGEVVIVRPED